MEHKKLIIGAVIVLAMVLVFRPLSFNVYSDAGSCTGSNSQDSLIAMQHDSTSQKIIINVVNNPTDIAAAAIGKGCVYLSGGNAGLTGAAGTLLPSFQRTVANLPIYNSAPKNISMSINIGGCVLPLGGLYSDDIYNSLPEGPWYIVGTYDPSSCVAENINGNVRTTISGSAVVDLSPPIQPPPINVTPPITNCPSGTHIQGNICINDVVQPTQPANDVVQPTQPACQALRFDRTAFYQTSNDGIRICVYQSSAGCSQSFCDGRPVNDLIVTPDDLAWVKAKLQGVLPPLAHANKTFFQAINGNCQQVGIPFTISPLFMTKSDCDASISAGGFQGLVSVAVMAGAILAAAAGILYYRRR